MSVNYLCKERSVSHMALENVFKNFTNPIEAFHSFRQRALKEHHNRNDLLEIKCH